MPKMSPMRPEDDDFKSRMLDWLENGGREEIERATMRSRRASEEFAKAAKPKWWTLWWPVGSGSVHDSAAIAQNEGGTNGTQA